VKLAHYAASSAFLFFSANIKVHHKLSKYITKLFLVKAVPTIT